MTCTLPVAPEVLERICDAHWNGKGDGVVFLDVYQHNACNHTLSGTIDVAGTIYGFIIDNGDWGGTVVRAWGDPEDVGVYRHPEPVSLRTFIPIDDRLSVTNPESYRLYLRLRTLPWFQEKERNYNYDRHFQPGGSIEEYYSKWAATRGMKTGYFEEQKAALR